MKPWALLLAGLLGATAWAAAFEPPPAPTRYVTDRTGFLSEATERTLGAKLERYATQTGRQIVVWVGADPGNISLEEFSVRTFEAWGIGQKGQDTGIGVFVFPDSRQVRIEVGYGLEATMTDAVADRIIREQFVPRARAGDPDGAVTATVDALLATLGGGDGSAAAQPQAEPKKVRGLELGFYAVVGLILFILFLFNPRLGLLLLFSIMNPGRGGGGGGGGGFGGGGGRSGGGGASGSW